VEKGIEYNDDSISTTYWHDTFGVQTADIVALSTGGKHTLYLQSDGTVIATGDNEHGQCDVQEWTGIVAISAADYHSIGLKLDGTVVAAGDNLYGECDVSDWTDIRVESIVNE
jgi:alpha-tubulin suppressor-like RCC1 family protein